MALAQIITECTLVWRDRENTTSTSTFYLPPPGPAHVNAQAVYQKARDIATAAQAISDCQLVELQVTFQDRDDVTVGAGEVESKGVFTFAVAGGTDYTTGVPGFKDALLESDRRTIAVTGTVQPQVQAFIDAVLTGPVGFNNGATNAAGRNLARVVEAKKAHVGSLVERRGKSG